MNKLFISAQSRGHAQHGWLDSHHSFSFADYYDPNRMGFSSLRVINEDKISPSQGFGTHPHKNMEIISYALSGILHHKDTLGNEQVIKPGEVQRMSAGSGISHSEYNGSKTETAHFLQIWILPETQNIQPGYEQKDFSQQFSSNPLTLVGSQTGREGSVTIHQNIDLYAGHFKPAQSLVFDPKEADRTLFIQMISGDLSIESQDMAPGDGFGFKAEKQVSFDSKNGAEFLLFDML